MPEITKIYGIPGSGKTTQLLTEFEKITSAGMPLEQIAFVTFSKSAGMEIKNRILSKFDVDRSDLVWCGTIHSICNRLLDWDLKNDIPKLASEHDRADYLLQYGLTYPIVNTFSNDIPETTISDGDIGQVSDEEKIFAVINWCNNRLVPLNNWKNIEVTFDHIDPSFVFEICKGWLEYKQEKGLVDFDDMLLKTIEQELYPNIKVLLVDEFQDLTPLLYNVISLWSKWSEIVFIAGDDDQTIYTWAGASPDFLLNLPGKEVILSDSHRVPLNILEKAETLISTVKNRRYKKFHSIKQDGQFIHLSNPSFSDLMQYFPSVSEKTIYFLFRTNFLANRFCTNHLIPSGIPFTKLKPQLRIPKIWTKRLVDIRNAVVKIQQNKPLASAEVQCLLEILPSCSKGKHDSYVRYGKKTWFKKNNTKNEWTSKEILDELLLQLPKWNSREVMRELGNDLQKKAYAANIQEGYYSLSPYKIKVGTLHSAKGLEADVVFVFNSHTKTIENHLLDQGQSAVDDEKRLYYVGITRAKETCILADDFFDKYIFDMGI